MSKESSESNKLRKTYQCPVCSGKMALAGPGYTCESCAFAHTPKGASEWETNSMKD